VKPAPFWWEQAPREAASETEQPATADVAVVGAGFTGLNTALVLARAGLSVVVFEAGILGEGASTRNGGMVGPSFHKLGIAGLTAQYGKQKTNEIVAESVGFVDFLKDFLKVENINADFAQTGRFRGALKSAHYDAMARELASLQQSCNVSGHMVSRQDQASETGSDRFYGGVVYDMDGGLHPAKYHDGLVQRVRQAGAVILSQTPVEQVQKSGNGFQLATPKGKITAQQVAICTNGYTGSQFQQFRRRILPLRSAMIATEPLDEKLLARLMPKARMYGDSRRIVAYYRLSPDGQRILFGGRATGRGENPEKNARQLRSSMVEIYPDLADTPVSHVWSGRLQL